MTYSHSELSDRQEITDLLSAYCRAVDDNRPDGVVDLFTEDCHLDYGGKLPIVEGHAAATKFFTIGTDRLSQGQRISFRMLKCLSRGTMKPSPSPM